MTTDNVPAPVKDELFKVDLTKISIQKDELIDQASRVVVENDEQEKLAGDLLKMVKNAIAAAEEERTGIVKPFNDGVKNINAKYKEITGPLETAKEQIEKAMKPYALKKLNEQEERERLAQVALENQAVEQAAAAPTQEKAEEVLNTAVAAVGRIHQSSSTRGHYGSVTNKQKKYKFEIIDVEQIPRAYLVPDEKKIRAAINGKDRVKEIPGVKIVEDVQFSSR
jgi:hypothetical protein